MHDVNHALANLASLTGLPELAFDADGNLSLIFNGDTTVNLARIDDKTIELWAELDDLRGASDAAMLRRILAANHLGEGTGAARIALTPGGDVFVLCERVVVEPLTGDQFADRIIAFLKYAMFWNSADGAGSVSWGAETPPVRKDDFLMRA